MENRAFEKTSRQRRNQWLGKMLTLLAVSGAVLESGSTAFAQQIDGRRPFSRERLTGAGETARSRGNSTALTSPRSPDSQALRRTEAMAARLIRESREAFDRALMPVADYADHLAVARHLKVTAAELRDDEIARKAAMTEHAVLLNRAAEQIEALNQPNARAYHGELFHAKALAARADAEVALENNNWPATTAASQRADHFATEHLRVRTADYQTGRATLPELLRAYSEVADLHGSALSAEDPPEGFPGAWKPDPGRLQDVVEQMTQLEQNGVRGVREDQLQSLQFALSRLEGRLASVNGDDHRAEAAIHQAEQQSRELFDTQLEFYKHGTASLFDMTRTWWQRYQLHSKADEADREIPESALDRRGEDLHKLEELAGEITDQRGRIAADVTFVRGLRTLQELRDAQKSAAEAVEDAGRPSAPSQKPEAGASPYVIEFDN